MTEFVIAFNFTLLLAVFTGLSLLTILIENDYYYMW